jgi:FXSXX-COOH protein
VQSTGDGEFVSEMADLTDIPLLPLLDLYPHGDSVLVRSIRRLLAEAADPSEAIAGFSAYI